MFSAASEPDRTQRSSPMMSRRRGKMVLNILGEISNLRTRLLLLCCLLCVAGDETIPLQEVEGTSITLHTGITGIQSDAQIQWFYGPERAEERILNSLMFKGEMYTEISERFKERLQLDRISGALTIRNLSRNLSGVYSLLVIAGTGRLLSRTFSVSVYAPVSTPVIINERGKRSAVPTARCSLLCAVKNGEDVTLSWYRGTERISITNNTDLSVNLSLSLQTQNHQNIINTYICVSANPASNKTTFANIAHLCDHHSEQPDRSGSLLPVLLCAAGFLLLIFIFIAVRVRMKTNNNNNNNKILKKLQEVIDTEVKMTNQSAERLTKEGTWRSEDEEQVTIVTYSAVRSLQ